MKNSSSAPLKKSIIRVTLVTALILLIPLVAMQFTDEVKWDVRDFVVIGTLLLGTGFGLELIVRKISNVNYRIALCALLVIAFLLIWVDLAVGIFELPFSGS